MQEIKDNGRVGHLERLRRKMKTDIRTTLSSVSSKVQSSSKFSDNHFSVFQKYYKFGQKIGQGAHAVVKKVYDIQTAQVFAVKIQKADQQKIQYIKQNFLMCKFLKHPSIIKHHQLFINRRKQQTILVMQYCSYSSLQSFCKIKMNRIQLANIMKILLQAICQLHKNGICHRDIKPANILYNKQTKKIKIIDLGISKLIFNKKTWEKQKMWSRTGTMQYKAPQMFQGNQYDQKIDAWALGVVAYQLAYSKLPFDSEFEMNLINEILQKQPQFQSSTCRQDNLLINFIKGLLRKDPKHRINCFEALRHPFIFQSQSDTKLSRYQNLFHLDKFSSKISRSRSLDAIMRYNLHIQGIKVRGSKKLHMHIIQETPKNYSPIKQ